MHTAAVVAACFTLVGAIVLTLAFRQRVSSTPRVVEAARR
jgi:hypothetical protein